MSSNVDMKHTWYAIVRMVLAMACFAWMNVLIRYVAHEIPTPQIVFLRNVCAVFWLLPFLYFKGLASLKTSHIVRHCWRAGIGVMSMELWFYALAIMPITQATALSFTSPLWATLFAVVFLKERIGVHRVAALMVGFMGAMIIIRPSAGFDVNLSVAVVLMSAMLMAVSSILVKALTATDPTWRIVFYMSVFMTVFSAPFGLYVWQSISGLQFIIIMAVAGASVMAHLLMVSAFARASMVVLMPLDFVRLVFTALLAHIFFDEMIDVWTVCGSIVIIMSTCYISLRERRLARIKPSLCEE